MERVKLGDPKVEGKIKWKKVGGGSLRMGNKIIKPGQIFEALPTDIPKAFRDLFIPMNGDTEVWKEPAAKIPAPAEIATTVYTAKQREGSQWWDIFDTQGKKQNDKGLKEETAKELVQKLNK